MVRKRKYKTSCWWDVSLFKNVYTYSLFKKMSKDIDAILQIVGLSRSPTDYSEKLDTYFYIIYRGFVISC